NSVQKSLQQRIVSTAQDHRIGVAKSVCEGLGEINSSHLLSHGVFYPSFFNQRDEQRASLFACLQPARFESSPVSVAANGGLSSNHNNLLVSRGRRGRLCPGLNHAYHRNMRSRRDAIEGERGRRVAGDHHHLRPVRFKEMSSLHGVATDRVYRL